MAFVASQLIEEVTANVQSDSLKDVQEICADSTYFPNNLHRRLAGGIVLKGSSDYSSLTGSGL